ncbi:hypothetical protein [Streptomyces sp. Da 82-17]|uniref:hypothetical protein n=1 Tax=Streptomyces sp. Da 82-17 TaxID=3377116 RepID=UPI0038D403EB
MSPIDELLERARLIRRPYDQADTAAAEARLAARTRAPTDPRPTTHHTNPALKTSNTAAQDLTNLCESVVAQPEALVSLRIFLAQAMPEPVGARVLGCLLQLAAQEESARFWWQYAAGAGDSAATYCLFLHHRALGEEAEANWWHSQNEIVAAQNIDPDIVDITTALRVLRALKSAPRTYPEAVHAVLGYIPLAVSYVDDDLDLPLPEADFTERVLALSGQAAGAAEEGSRTDAPLPERERGATVIGAGGVAGPPDLPSASF